MKNKFKTLLISICLVALPLNSESKCMDNRDDEENKKIQQQYNEYYKPKDLGSSSKNIDGNIFDLNLYLINLSITSIEDLFSLGADKNMIKNMVEERIRICKKILKNMDHSTSELQRDQIFYINIKISEFENKLLK